MRSILLTLVMVILPLYAQHTWTLQNPLPHNYDLTQVVMPSSDLVIAIGDQGVVQRRSVSDREWELQFLGQERLTGICFLDSMNGWISSFSEAYYSTSDGGDTWNKQDIGLIDMLNDIFFIDLQNGWACTHQGCLMRTKDGGQSWQVEKSVDTRSFYKVRFFNADTGWALASPHQVYGGNPQVLTTVDGGETWSVHQLDTPKGLIDFVFLNAETALALSFNSLFKSNDGGQTWEEQTIEIANNWYYVSSGFTSIHFIEPAQCWISTTEGVVLESSDAGESWTAVPIDEGAPLSASDVFFFNSQQGWIAGEGGLVYETLDSGETWVKRFSGSPEKWNSVKAIDEQTAYVAGEKSVVKTTDGGHTWTAVYKSSYRINAMDFLTAQQGWLVPKGSAPVQTTDGGETWNPVAMINDPCQLVFFLNESLGWLISEKNFSSDSLTIWRTLDGGLNWESLHHELAGTFQDLQFVTPDSGWICANRGVLWQTIDGGETWTKIELEPRAGLNSVDFIDSKQGWLGGNVGWIFSTEDGGETWELMETDLQGHIFDVERFDAQHAWLSTSEGNLYYTRDGGDSWLPVSIVAQRWLYDMDFVNQDVGWVVGDAGLIKKTTNGTIVHVKSDIEKNNPLGFSLEQNYPNPFNPNTTLTVNIDKSGHVHLEIVNLLGQRIKVLHDQVLYPGEHRFVWQAVDQPSGVYFAILRKGDHVKTVKLLLQK